MIYALTGTQEIVVGEVGVGEGRQEVVFTAFNLVLPVVQNL